MERATAILLQLGVASHFVQRIARHANSRTTLDTYGHLVVDDLRAGLEALGRAAESPQSPTEPTPSDSLPPEPPPTLRAVERRPPGPRRHQIWSNWGPNSPKPQK